jgi:Ras-related protein Rab-11A
MTSHKAVLCGGVGVGKSSLARVLTTEDFHSREPPTLGSATFPLTVRSTSNEQYSVMLWDTAGQEQFEAIAGYYFHAACIAIAVCDLTRAETLAVLERVWLPVMRSHAPADVAIIVVGNKSDCADQRQIDLDQLIEFSEQIDAFAVLESSAQTSEGLPNLRQKIGDALSAIISKKAPLVEEAVQERDAPQIELEEPEQQDAHTEQLKGRKKRRIC